MPIAKSMLYIFCFLHQTTTCGDLQAARAGCISFVSYIKPQPCNLVPISATGCISFVSYIKPQLRCRSLGSHRVVYLLFPTSNHNPRSCAWRCFRLYIFCFLHQTTTVMKETIFVTVLYIFCFLHQTTTVHSDSPFACMLYIFCFLHQTTTAEPTFMRMLRLYIFCFLHQTTTGVHSQTFSFSCISFVSYIKPQLYCVCPIFKYCCISFVSYIKPQPITFKYKRTNVL